MRESNNKKPSKTARPFHGIAAFFGKVWRAILRTLRRIRDRKTHVYRSCPVCKSVLRLPRTSGEHGVNCPACHGHFMVRIKR